MHLDLVTLIMFVKRTNYGASLYNSVCLNEVLNLPNVMIYHNIIIIIDFHLPSSSSPYLFETLGLTRSQWNMSHDTLCSFYMWVRTETARLSLRSSSITVKHHS
jgi:hypothetical protein